MNAQSLFLTPNQVPLGMLAYVCAPGTTTPEVDDTGARLPPLKLLLGGVGTRTKWYVFDPIMNGMPSGSFEYDAIRDGSLFTPVETFSVGDAPVREEYAVFVDGERLKYKAYPKQYVKVAKATDGRIVSCHGYAYDHWLREFALPEGAVLVQTGSFSAEWDFALLGCIGIPKPTAEQRAALEKLGIVFFDHAPFATRSGMVALISVGFSFRDYVAVRLPTGWRVLESRGWYFRCPFKFEIQDGSGNPIASISQEPLEHSERATWTGTLTLV